MLSEEKIKERVKRIRIEKGIKQSDFATLVGISQGAYSNFENGGTELSISKLNKIATALGVSVQYLLFGVEQEPKKDDSEKDRKIKELEKEMEILAKMIDVLKYENKIFFGLIKTYEYYAEHIIKKQEETQFLDKLSGDDKVYILGFIEHYKSNKKAREENKKRIKEEQSKDNEPQI